MSAVVTGLLLALNLPVSIPLWMAALGGVFAILVVKMLFGGLGQNFMNPALAARCFLLISFPSQMTNFACDAYTGATPLAALKAGESVNVMNMIVGKTAGTIGETSVIALLIGACFLILIGVIDLRIPGTYIVTVILFVGIFGGHGFDPAYLSAQLAGGGLILGAFSWQRIMSPDRLPSRDSMYTVRYWDFLPESSVSSDREQRECPMPSF